MNVLASNDAKQRLFALYDVYKINFTRFAADCLRIRTKSGEIKPLILNSVQIDLVKRFEAQMKRQGFARFIILKARQQGLSTLIEALNLWWAIFHRGFKGLVLTHLDSATQELFEMTRRYYDHLPDFFKPRAYRDSVHELNFRGIDSAIKTATAGSRNAGHGSTFQGVHWSEVSRSKNQLDMVKGVLQTVPLEQGTFVFLESTANGLGDFFHESWLGAVRGDNGYEPVFYAWFETPEYRLSAEDIDFTTEEREYQALYGIDDEQLAWRRYKILNMSGGSDAANLKMFREQYPSTPDEAFQSDEFSFISPESVAAAMQPEVSFEPVGAVVIGIDPARQGKNGTGVVVRQGRVVLSVERWKLDNTMDIAGRVARLIDKWQPDGVFVDVIGVGAGMYDRLNELGYSEVFQAVVSKKATLEDNFVNKRAEIWSEMRNWLNDGAKLPENQALREDLLMLSFSEDSKNRLKLQSKQNLSRSPDLGDALALTFYAPVSSRAAVATGENGVKYGRTGLQRNISIRA